MFVRKQVESKRVPMINIGTLFICYVLYPGFFKQTVSVVRIEILVVIQKELCQYRVVVVHFQLAFLSSSVNSKSRYKIKETVLSR